MSHFTKLDRAQIKSDDAFVKACEELGFSQINRNAILHGYMGRTHKADVTACVPGASYDVGLVKNIGSGKFDLIADWWGVCHKLPAAMSHCSQTDVQDTILRTTTKHWLIDTYRKQGFAARVHEDKNKNVTVTLTR